MVASARAKAACGLLGALVLGYAACARESPDQAYQRALTAFRQGLLKPAQDQAGAAARRCPADSSCWWRSRLLEAEALLYQSEKEGARVILSAPMPAGPEFAGLEARRQMLLGYLSLTDRPQEAEKYLDQADQRAAALGLPALRVEVALLKGALLPDRQAAETVLREAWARVRQQNDSYQEAQVLNTLGFFRLQSARFDEAIPWFQQALAAARQAGARISLVAILNNLAISFTQIGNFDQALMYRREALQLLAENEVRTYRRDVLGEIGRTYMVQGDFPQAVAHYRQALALARELKLPSETWRWANNLALALTGMADWDGAEAANQEAQNLAADARQQANTRLNAARIAAGRSHYDQAAALYQQTIAAASDLPSVLWSSYDGLGRVYAERGDTKRAGQYLGKALEVIDKNRTGLSRDEYKITFLSRLISFYQNYVETLAAHGAWDRALGIADSSRARILAEKMSLAAPARAATANDYQRLARRSGSVLLSYWLAPRQSYLWVITGSGVQHYTLPEEKQIRDWVEQYQTALEKEVRDPMETEIAAGRRLYDALIAPARISPGARVVLVPDGALHRLNFETLPVYGDQRHYWIKDATVSIAPSLSILAMKAPAARSQKAMLILGDPLYTGTPYERLEFASLEIEKIRGHFDAWRKKVVTGAEVHPAVYRETEPKQFGIIHFSAHAEANSQSPLDSAVILSRKTDQFKLYARDVQQVPLAADLVTLSACRSAGARSYAGEGLVGFAWAFLQAGARHVVAGLWDVTDRSTPALMDHFYGELEAGQDPAAALRQAKLAMIAATGPYRKPYYWGPFQVYRGPGP
ncbi:MAG: CHAT domain-containing protein [Candidatus Solibacter usitatus]|nr:CHAT domain-containing protein [Candidatus Solibacter usitatus]